VIGDIMNWKKIVSKKFIGKGTFGKVYKVTDEKGAIGALKIIDKQYHKFRIQFKSAFEITRKINDINYVKAIQWLSDKDVSWVMEYVDGKPISSLKFTDRHYLDKILKYMIQVCNGLMALHSRNIIHRDLKPQNILLDSNNIVKITDFDFIKIEQTGTQISQFIGTPVYASPEHFISSYDLDIRSDLYSLGVILYELITGKLPIEGRDAKEIGDKHRLKSIILPTKINPLIPKGVEKLIIGLLEKNPKDRYQHAHTVAMDLFKEIKNKKGVKVKSDILYLLKPGFVNREIPLKTLNELSDELASKNGKVVLILGESGIGKSKLIQQFYHYLQFQDVNFHYSVCKPVEYSFEPLTSIFEEILAAKTETEKLQYFGRFGWDMIKFGILAEKEWMNKIEKPVELSGESAEIRLFNAMTSFIQKAAAKPLVICIDDLQWADNAILKWLVYAEKNLKEFPVLIVGLHRTEQLIDDSLILSIENLIRIKIKNLKGVDVSDMIRSMLGKKSSSTELDNFIKSVISHTKGNPLFIREILYYLQEKGKIKIENNKWKYPRNLEIQNLPSDIHGIILERIHELSRETLIALQTASIIGKKFSFEMLLNMTQKNDIELLDDLIDCREVSLIEESANDYIFIHDKVREVLENEIKEKYPSFWKGLHLKAGEFLEEKYASNPDEVLDDLANHFYFTEQHEKSANYLELAGDKAKKNYQNEKALNYYNKLVESLRSLLNIGDLVISRALRKINEKDPKSILLLKRLAKAYYRKCDIYDTIRKPEDAISEANISLAIAEKTGDKKYIILVHYILVWCYSHSLSNGKTFFDKALKHSKVALKLSEELESAEYIVNSLSRIGLIYSNMGEYDKAAEYISKSYNLSKKINDKDGIALSYLIEGRNLRLQGNFTKGIEYLEKGLKVKEDFVIKYNVMCIYWNLGNVYVDKGEFEVALKYFFKAFEIQEEMNENVTIPIRIGFAYYYKGEYERSLDYFRRAENIFYRIDDKRTRLTCLNYITDTLCILKKYPEAKKTNVEALELSQRIKDKEEIVMSNIWAARISFLTSKTEKDKIEKGIKPLENLLKQEKDEELIALLNFELWKMKKDFTAKYAKSAEVNRKIAIELYHRFYKKEPRFYYKHKIEELEKLK